jgi:hypothetical protein
MTPDEEDQVRRLLAAAGEPAPTMPRDVADRLDGVLQDLAAERADRGGDALVESQPPADAPTAVGLADRRDRRRRWGRTAAGALVAAAVLSVVGVGVGTVLTGTGGDSAMSGSAENDSGAGGLGDGAGPESLTAESAPDQSAPQGDRDADGSNREVAPDEGRVVSLDGPRPRLASDRLASDVQRVADRVVATQQERRDDRPGSLGPCLRPRAGAGDDLVPVWLDEARAVLVLRRAESGRRTALVYACDDAATPVVRTSVDTR